MKKKLSVLMEKLKETSVSEKGALHAKWQSEREVGKNMIEKLKTEVAR